MRHAAIFLAISIFAANASALTVPVTIPTAAENRFAMLCEILRVRNRILPADWDAGDCASEILRRGVRVVEREIRASRAAETASDTLAEQLATFDTDFPDAKQTTACGDGVIQASFGETCDDGNTNSGDGCDSACLLE